VLTGLIQRCRIVGAIELGSVDCRKAALRFSTKPKKEPKRNLTKPKKEPKQTKERTETEFNPVTSSWLFIRASELLEPTRIWNGSGPHVWSHDSQAAVTLHQAHGHDSTT
jgi:hypothetical protein